MLLLAGDYQAMHVWPGGETPNLDERHAGIAGLRRAVDDHGVGDGGQRRCGSDRLRSRTDSKGDCIQSGVEIGLIHCQPQRSRAGVIGVNYDVIQILIPGNLVESGGRGEDVQIAVAIHVCRKYTLGPARRGVDDMACEILAAVVLVPADIPRGGEDIGVAVSIQVRRKHAHGIDRVSTDHVRREVLVAVVLIPGDFVIAAGRGEDVGVAVAVHVRRIHAAGTVGSRGDGT